MKKLIVLSAATVVAAFVNAESYSWTGGGTDATSWSDAGNWNPNGVPGGGDTATFSTAATIASGIAINSDTLTVVLSAKSTSMTLGGVISGEGALNLTAAGSSQIIISGDNTYAGGTRIEGGATLQTAKACGTNRTITYKNAAVVADAAGAVFAYDLVPEAGNVSLDFKISKSGELDGNIGANGLGTGITISQTTGDTDFVIRGRVFGNVNSLCVNVRPRNTTTSDCGIKVLGGMTAYGVYRDKTGDGWSHGWFGLGGASSLSRFEFGWSQQRFLSENAAGGALLYFGSGAYGYSAVDLNGYNQTVKGVSSVETARSKTERNITSASAATLTMRASGNQTAHVAVNGAVSLVLSSTSSGVVQEFLNRASATTGALIASNGVLRIGADASFENVPKLVAANGGTIDIATGISGAFKGVRLIEVADGGKLTVSSDAANAFSANSVVLRTGSEATVELGAGVSLSVAEYYVNETQQPAGTYKIGDGTVIVPLTPSAESTGVWIGEGNTDRTTEPANWQGGYPGSIGLVFALGGSQALLAADMTPTELVFDLPESDPAFAILADESAPNAKISLSGDIVMTNATATTARTVTLEVPVSFAASSANISIDGERNKLVVNEPLGQTGSSVTLNRYGTGTLVLNEGEGSLAGKVYVNGGKNLVGGGALGGTASSPTYVEVNPNSNGGTPISFRWTGGTYNQNFQFIRTSINDLSLAAASGSTNVINGYCNYRTNYGNSYVFEEDSVTTFNGGVLMNWLYDDMFKSEFYGAKVAVNNKPLQLTYCGTGKFVSFSSKANNKRSELRFGAKGNFARSFLLFAGGLNVVFDVDFAFDANDTTGVATPISCQIAPYKQETEHTVTFDFNGHSQRFGQFFRLTSSFSNGRGFWGNATCVMTSAAPASVYVRMNGAKVDKNVTDAADFCDYCFAGALSLVKEGTNTLTLAATSTTTGRLEVAVGTLAFTTTGSMTNVSEVVLSGGELVVDTAKRLPDRTVYRLSGGKLNLQSGVNLKASRALVSDGNGGWNELRPGVHRATDLPNYICGEGSLRVLGGGLSIFIR